MRAHREGVVTSASLVVSGVAAEEAIALAKDTPTLAVGLHVVAVGERATLSPSEIPHLVDGKGCFPNDPLQVGLHCFLSDTIREELKRELVAQFDRFAATGLPLSHVDSHLHMHLHPTLFDLLLPLAERYGAHGIRIPRDDLWLSLSYDRRRAVTKAAWAIIFGLLTRRCLGHLKERQLAVPHRVYGVLHSGRMTEAYVMKTLGSLNVPSAELYFHPNTAADGEALGPNPDDLAALISPKVRGVIRGRGLHMSTYFALAKRRFGQGREAL